jgi:hypothetical protein
MRPIHCLLSALALLGCKHPNSHVIVHPLESTLGTAVPAAFTAAVAMSALGGNVSPCASVTPQANSSRVDIHLGPGCPSLFGNETSGTIVVTGVWTPQLATFLADYTQANQGLLVQKIASMTVVPQGSRLIIAYAQQGVSFGTDSQTTMVGLQQTIWGVEVDTRGTADPSDDIINISGGDQSLLAGTGPGAAADITQVAVGAAVFHAGCRRNPNEGIAAVQQVGTLGGGWLLFTFHSACDGKADVSGARAPYQPMLGRPVTLDFLQ